MAKWCPFTIEELQMLAAQKLTLAEAHMMVCPHCKEQTIRVYIHDLPVNPTKTAEWIWCKTCMRFAHYRVAALSKEYRYNDPLDKSEYRGKDLLTGDKWYDFLNGLYDSGDLPQEITKR